MCSKYLPKEQERVETGRCWMLESNTWSGDIVNVWRCLLDMSCNITCHNLIHSKCVWDTRTHMHKQMHTHTHTVRLIHTDSVHVKLHFFQAQMHFWGCPALCAVLSSSCGNLGVQDILLFCFESTKSLLSRSQRHQHIRSTWHFRGKKALLPLCATQN